MINRFFENINKRKNYSKMILERINLLKPFIMSKIKRVV